MQMNLTQASAMKEVLNKLFEDQCLSRKEAHEILKRIANKEYNDSQIAAFTSVFIMRSVSVEEFLGFVDALLELCVDAQALQAYNPIDIVGTGGDNKNTFNISTLSSFVLAAAGYKVAKHGNYAASSVSGASTVMQEFGVKFTNDISKLERSLEKTNMAYLHAPLFNEALKAVAPVRKQLGIRTIFNMLGPIANPARPKQTVLGVYNLKAARIYSYIYQHTNVNYSILHSLDGYDEISLTGAFKLINKSGEFIYSPDELGFKTLKEADLYGGNTVEAASKIFSDLIENKAGESQKNVVIANSAIAINTMNPALNFADCILQAKDAIESGKLKKTFTEFLELNS